jgi:hypothetical protein
VNSSRVMLGALVVGLLACGVGCAGPRAAARDTGIVEATGDAFLEKADTGGNLPGIEWDSVLEGKGTGLPATNAATADQKMITACKAAYYEALADLVAKVSGTQVRQESRVVDMQFAGETVQAGRSAVLEGVKVVSNEYDPQRQVATAVVQVGLDKAGHVIPERLLPVTPLSLQARRVRAEGAAKTQALAHLREKIGDVWVTEQIQVKNLALNHQSVSTQVEGLLHGAELSKTVWLSPEHCQVKATVRLGERDLARMRGTIGMTQ